MISIYALSDPITCEIKYIGQTKDPTKRMYQHSACKSHCRKDYWIRGLKAGQLKPEMHIIEVVPQSEARESEMFWIDYYNFLGAELVNSITSTTTDNNHIRKDYKSTILNKYLHIALSSHNKFESTEAVRILREINSISNADLLEYALNKKYLH